jgi:hypothetical protein
MTFEQMVGASMSVLCAVACGGGGSSTPDAPPGVDAGVDAAGNSGLTIKLYNHFPFVEGDTSNGDFVAAQDGDGPWTQLTGDHGVYTMPRSADRYGVLVVCRFGTTTVTKVFLKWAAEGLLHTTSSCQVDPAPAKVPVTVKLRNIPTGMTGVVTGPTTTSARGSDGDVVLQLAPTSNELFAWLYDAQMRASKMVRIPPFVPQAAQSFTIDFTAGADLDHLPLTVGPTPPEAVLAGVTTATGEYDITSGAPGSTYAVPPAALRRPGDRILVEVFGDPAINQTARAELVTPGPLTINLLPALTGATVSATTGAAPVPTWTLPALPATRSQARVLMVASTSRASDGVNRRWQVFLARARLAGMASLSYTLPDFAALPGFPSDLALLGRNQLDWTATADDITTQADGSTILVTSSTQGKTGEYCGNGTTEPPETCDPPNGTTCSNTCTSP